MVASGCAYTKTSIPLNLNPTVNKPLQNVSAKTLSIAAVQDNRSVMDKCVVVQKQNAYGTTKGAYVAPRPVSEIFQEALIKALEANKFPVSPGKGVLRLDTTIEEIDLIVIS